jgi:uncharacterized membrane protein YkvA (DUF1232 family)
MRLAVLIARRRRHRRFAMLQPRHAAARRFAAEMIRQLPALLKLVFRLFRDPRIGLANKALFAAVAWYVLAPIDLIPDVLGFVGLIDDVYFVGLALNRMIAAAGPDILLEHWDGDPYDLGFIVAGVEDIGALLPDRVRSILQSLARA